MGTGQTCMGTSKSILPRFALGFYHHFCERGPMVRVQVLCICEVEFFLCEKLSFYWYVDLKREYTQHHRGTELLPSSIPLTSASF